METIELSALLSEPVSIDPLGPQLPIIVFVLFFVLFLFFFSFSSRLSYPHRVAVIARQLTMFRVPCLYSS